MADNKRRGRFGRGSEDESSQSIFDLFEPPPETDGSSLTRIPIIREEGDGPGLVGSDLAEAQASAEAEAAGLAHWTEPPTGQVPASLASMSQDDRWADVRGPSWQGEEPNWAGPDLSDVFADTEAISHRRVVEDDELPVDLAPTMAPRRRPAPLSDAGVPPPVEARRRPPAPAGRHPQGQSERGISVDRVVPPAGVSRPVPPSVFDDKPMAPLPRQAVPDPTPAPAGGDREAFRPAVGTDQARSTRFDDAPVPPPPVRPPPARRGAHDLPPDPVVEPPMPTARVAAAPPQRSVLGERKISVEEALGESPRLLAEEPAGARVPPAPVRDMAARAVPTYDEPTYDEPTYDEPTYDEPAYDEPAYDEPAYDEPAYDEPAYNGYGDDEAPSRGVGQRVLVGVGLVALVGVTLSLGPDIAMVLVGLITLLAVMELFNTMRVAGLRPATLLGLVGAVALPAATYVRGETGYPLVVGLAVVFGMLWYLTGADTERPVLNLGLTLMGILWVGGLAAFAALILRAEGGVGLLLATIVITALSDTLAYVGGRAYGTRPFHSASPNKTWEGTLTGFFGALLGGLILGVTDVIDAFDGQFISVMVMAAVIGVLAPIGDLSESLVKRDLGVKDMGHLLPGHGGVLDRVDGLLFALPGAYYVAVVFELL